MPKISIVMPTYNQAKFIKSAIDSILNQTFQDFEIIVVNDGSTDDTENIIKSYSDKRIIYLPKQHEASTGLTLNTGFKIATGEYETWFASDNLMYPECLEKLNTFLDNHPEIDYVYSGYDRGVVDDTGFKEIKKVPSTSFTEHQYNIKKTITDYYFGINWLWRSNLRKKCGEWQKEISEDYDMILRMEEQGGKFAYLPEILGYYRKHNNNLTTMLQNSPEPNKWCYFVQDKAKVRRGLDG